MNFTSIPLFSRTDFNLFLLANSEYDDGVSNLGSQSSVIWARGKNKNTALVYLIGLKRELVVNHWMSVNSDHEKKLQWLESIFSESSSSGRFGYFPPSSSNRENFDNTKAFLRLETRWWLFIIVLLGYLDAECRIKWFGCCARSKSGLNIANWHKLTPKASEENGQIWNVPHHVYFEDASQGKQSFYQLTQDTEEGETTIIQEAIDWPYPPSHHTRRHSVQSRSIIR